MTEPSDRADLLRDVDDHERTNERLSTPDQRFEERLGRSQSAELLQRRIIDQETLNLAVALDRIAESGTLPRAASLIVAARRRYVTGAAKSAGYAALLSSDLAVGLSHVTHIDDSVVRALDVLPELRTTDVLVAFSFRRYRRSTIDIVEHFARAGGSVVVISDRADAPAVAFATEAIIVSTDSESYADSPTAVAAVSHVLATLVTASAKGARRRIAAREQLGQTLGLYS